MKTCSASNLLAAKALVHIILMLANFWLGTLSLGFLIQDAEVMGGELKILFYLVELFQL